MSSQPPVKPLRIGLTGGVGSGKSTVSALFEALAVPVIDADVAAREVVRPGSEGLAAVSRAFGSETLTSAGELDRKALRERVFRDPKARKALEAILHPRIEAWMERQCALASSAPYVIFVVPLLVETGQHLRMDRVLVVDAPEELQIRRVAQRDGVAVARVRDMLAAQCPRRERLQAADDVIVNMGSVAALRREVEALHARYRMLGAQSA